MTDTDVLAVLHCAKRLYERDQEPIVHVFTMAAQSVGADDETKLEAIRKFILAMPNPEGILKIQDMLVVDLLDSFTVAIKRMEAA